MAFFIVLEAFTNAWTVDERENLWDMQLFGSPRGNCPPGSAILSANGEALSALPKNQITIR